MLKHHLGIPSLLLTLALALLLSTPSTAETFPAVDFDGGDGSIDSPYEIANLAQLRRLSEILTIIDRKHFVLTADIDATETNTWNVGDHDDNPDTPDEPMGFIPIRDIYGTSHFSLGILPGVFDGQGHVINNLYINSAFGFLGLFGDSFRGAIRNLGLENVDISGGYDAGGLVGRARFNTVIDNCYVTGTVTSFHKSAGGLAGTLHYESTITNSYAAVTVSGQRSVGGLAGKLMTGNNMEICSITNSYSTGTVSGGDETGGLVGYTAGGSMLTDCYATGEVSGLTKSGGLVGWNRGYISTSFATGAVLGKSSTGGLVGENTAGTITNSYATGEVSGHTAIAGLIGRNDVSCTITASFATGYVVGNENTGGLIGYNYVDGTVDASNYIITSSYWDMDTTRQDTSAGGTGLTSAQILQQSSFIGFDFSNPEWDIVEGQTRPYLPWQKVALHEGTATTDLTSLTLTGGYVFNPAVPLDEYGILLRENSTNTITYHPVGYDLSYDTGVSLNNVTVTDLDPSIAYLYSVYAIDAAGDIHVGTERFMTLESDPSTIVDFAYNGGNGSINTPYQIATLEYLQQLSEWPRHFNRHFILTADIDATDTNTWNVGDHDNNPETPDITSGFLPIGSITRPFTGTFDGQDHVITNLFINRPEDRVESVGFFGRVSGATISNLGIEGGSITGEGSVGGLIGKTSGSTIINCYTTGTVSGHMNYIGGLIGYTNWDTITDCYATGAVTGGDEYTGGLVGILQESSITDCYATGIVSGNQETGGLVGTNLNSTITSSYATGSVTGNYMVGGLAGVNRGDSITNSYATGSVTNSAGGDISRFTGGLVGHNYATITNCYATGSVSGPDYTGGFAGFNYSNGTITNCYSTGDVSGDEYTGGFLGHTLNEVPITACYWDIENSGQSTSAGGTALTSAQMLQQSSFTEFDFTTEPIWGITEGSTRPYLAWQTAALLEGSATVTSPTSVALDTGYVHNIIGSGTTLAEYGIAYREQDSDTTYFHDMTIAPLTEGTGTQLDSLALSALPHDSTYLYRVYAIDSNGKTHYGAESTIHRVVYLTSLDSLKSATSLVANNGAIKLDAGAYTETLTIDQPLTLERNGTTGTATIGN